MRAYCNTPALDMPAARAAGVCFHQPKRKDGHEGYTISDTIRRRKSSGAHRRRLLRYPAVGAIGNVADHGASFVSLDSIDFEDGIKDFHFKPGASFVSLESVELDSADAEESPSLWQLLAFALPTLAVWLVSPIMSLVDTAIVGMGSEIQLAALGPGTLLADSSAYIFTFLAVAVTNLVSLSMAKGDTNTVASTISKALGIALALGAALGLLLCAAAPALLVAMVQDPGSPLIAPAVSYIRLRAIGLPGFMVTQVAQAFFLSAKDPITPLVSVLAAGALNLAGDMLLCLKLGMGSDGAAIATALAQLATAGFLMLRMADPVRKPSPYAGMQISWSVGIPTWKTLMEFVQIAGPVCVALASKVVTYAVINAVAAGFGAVATAGHHITFSVFMFFAVFGDSVSQGAQAFLPSRVGFPQLARRMAASLLQLGAVMAACNSVAVLTILTLGAGAFTSSAAVVLQVQHLVPYAASAVILHTCSMATEGMLLAGRDLMFLVYSYLGVGTLVLGVLVAGVKAGLGLPTVWLGVNAVQISRLAVNLLRLAQPESPVNRSVPLA